jgi:hypothetical protein
MKTISHRIFLLKGSARIALDSASIPVVDEGDQVQFEISLPEHTAAMSYRIRLGDLLPEKALGVDLGDVVRWERGTWFDSCRGKVDVTLECNANSDASAYDSDDWELVLLTSVFVRPSKITEDQWIAMQGDLEAVAVELASDLVGKASAGLQRARLARTPLDEVAAARRFVIRFQRAISRIAEQPHIVLRATRDRLVATPRRLDGPTIKRLVLRGFDPRRRPTKTSARLRDQRPRPSFDVAEHRQMLGTLRAVMQRLSDGERRVASEIAELEADRLWRERPDDTPGTSLYDRLDRPRIQRLRAIAKECAILRRHAQNLADNPILASLSPQAGLKPSQVTRHVAPYRLAWRAMCAWNVIGRVQVDSGEQVRRKDTARMYEQWVFLQLASGLRTLGFELAMEEDLFRRIRQRRFLMDLPRGARLTFLRTDGVGLDLHFEPWIRSRDTAERMSDLLFHGRARDVAWSPDVLLMIHVSPGISLRALAIDAKYAKRLNEAHWSGVRKYFQIRRLADGGQAVDQVWLSAPGISGIRIEDDSIAWTAEGPDLPLGAGTIQGELGLIPTLGRKPGEAVPLVLDFLTGVLIHGGIALEAT